MNLGHEFENIVENLCKKSFFADFTIKSPKYRKSGGQEKEAADLLIVFNETLVAIQIKSKTINSSSVKPSLIELKRVSKIVDAAIHQFNSLNEALGNPEFKSFVNGRGIEISFDKKQIKEIILIVVFVPVWTDGADESTQIRFDNTCYPDGPIPIHLFTLKQFSLLLLLLDTLPDFLLYLGARWILHGEKLIPKDSDPFDEWAFLTFERKNFIEIIEKKFSANISGLGNRHAISIEELERKEKPSYFVDRLIEQLYAAIGLTDPIDPRFNLLAEPNSLKAYHTVIPHLVKLSRKDRGKFTEFLLNRVQKCQKSGFAFRGFKFSEYSDDGYLVLAAKLKREDRRIALSNIAMGMGHKLKAKKIIGLAVGNDWPESPECDVAVVDVSNLKPSADLIRMTEVAFRKPAVVMI